MEYECCSPTMLCRLLRFISQGDLHRNSLTHKWISVVWAIRIHWSVFLSLVLIGVTSSILSIVLVNISLGRLRWLQNEEMYVSHLVDRPHYYVHTALSSWKDFSATLLLCVPSTSTFSYNSYFVPDEKSRSFIFTVAWPDFAVCYTVQLLPPSHDAVSYTYHLYIRLASFFCSHIGIKNDLEDFIGHVVICSIGHQSNFDTALFGDDCSILRSVGRSKVFSVALSRRP